METLLGIVPVWRQARFKSTLRLLVDSKSRLASVRGLIRTLNYLQLRDNTFPASNMNNISIYHSRWTAGISRKLLDLTAAAACRHVQGSRLHYVSKLKSSLLAYQNGFSPARGKFQPNTGTWPLIIKGRALQQLVH
jgi:hypothetical protein